jgi:hypothetical protein
MEAPNPKFQAPNKLQASSTKPAEWTLTQTHRARHTVGAWPLELFWNLKLGTWCSVLPMGISLFASASLSYIRRRD